MDTGLTKEAFMSSIEDLDEKARAKLELATLLEQKLYLTSFRHFCLGCLGLDFPEIRDPQVQKDLDEVGALVLDWLSVWRCMNQKCSNWERDSRGERVRVPSTRRDHVCRRQERCRIIMLEKPRGTGKSFAHLVPLIVWIHVHESEMAMMIMSAEFERMAKKFSAAIKHHFMGTPDARLNELFGPFYDPNRKWTDEKMVTARRKNQAGEATVSVYSVETGATSGHYKFGGLDDPTTKALVDKYGDNWHDKVWAQLTDLRNTVIDRDGLLLMAYTRYAANDQTGRIKEQWVKPAVIKKFGKVPEDFDEKWRKYAKQLRNIDIIARKAVAWDKDGKRYAVYPTIHSLPAIDELRDEGPEGEEFYATQLQNEPFARADNPMTDEVLYRMKVPREKMDVEFLFDFVMNLDFAPKKTTGEDRGDKAVIEIWGHNEGRICMVWGWSGRVTLREFGDQFVRALQWCKRSKIHTTADGRQMRVDGRMPRIITCDQPTGDSVSRKPWLIGLAHREGMACPRIIEINRNEGMVGKKKKQRSIEATFPYIIDGRVFVCDDVPILDEFQYELKALGFHDHDDHADAYKDNFHPDVYRPNAKSRHGAVEEMHGRFGPRPMVPGEFDDETGRFVPAPRHVPFQGSRGGGHEWLRRN